MKNLLKAIWEAPASTSAGAITAGLTFVMASDIDLPPWVVIMLGSTSAILSVFSGAKKDDA